MKMRRPYFFKGECASERRASEAGERKDDEHRWRRPDAAALEMGSKGNVLLFALYAILHPVTSKALSRATSKREPSVVEGRLALTNGGASRFGLTVVFGFLRVQARFTSSQNSLLSFKGRDIHN